MPRPPHRPPLSRLHALLAAIALLLPRADLSLLLAEDPPAPRKDSFGDPLPNHLRLSIGTRRFTCDPPAKRGAFSMKGDRMALTASGAVYVMDSETGVVTGGVAIGRGSPPHVALSPDPSCLATADGGTVRLWDIPSRKPLRDIETGGRWMQSLRFSADGATLVAVASDGAVHVLDPMAGKALRTLPGTPGSSGWLTALNPDATALALWRTGAPLLVLGLPKGEERARIEVEDDNLVALAFLPRGITLLGLSRDGRVRHWDVDSGREMLSYDAHDGTASHLLVTSDGKRVVTLGEKPGIRVGDAGTGEELSRYDSSTAHADAAGLVSEDRTLAVISERFVHRYRLDEPIGPIELETPGGSIEAMALSPDGRALLIGSGRGRLSLWEADHGGLLKRFPANEKLIIALAWAPDGRRAASMEHGGTVRVWRVPEGEEVARLPSEGYDTEGLVGFVCGSENLVLLRRTGPIRFWDPSSDEPPREVPHRHEELLGATLSPDGRWMATQGREGRLRIWDAASGEERLDAEALAIRPWTLRWSPDGRYLAGVTPQGGLRAWEAASGTPAFHLAAEAEQANHLAFSLDGLFVALAGGTMQIGAGPETVVCVPGQPWNGVRMRDLQGGVSALEFLHDGKCLATGGLDGTVQFSDVVGYLESNREDGTMETLWRYLGEAEGPKGAAARKGFFQRAEKALPILAERLSHPLAPTDSTKEAARLLLADDEAGWEEAKKRIVEGGADALPALNEAWSSAGSPEARARVEGLLRPLEDRLFLTRGELLRRVGAVEALERIGSPEAIDALRRLAGGPAWAKETKHAASSLKRLARLAERHGRPTLPTWKPPQGGRLPARVVGRVAFSGGAGATRSLTFHPGLTLLAGSRADGWVEVWDLSAGKTVATWAERESPIVRFSADGTRLGWLFPDGSWRFRETGTWRDSSAREAPASKVAGVHAPPHLPDVTLAFEDGTIALHSWADGARIDYIQVSKTPVRLAAWSADRSLFAVLLAGRGIKVFHSEGRVACQFPDLPDSLLEMTFSPDDRALLFVDARGLVHEIDLTRGDLTWSIQREDTGAPWLTMDPRGRVLALGGASGAFSLWDRVQHEEIGGGDLHGIHATAFDFTPAGSHLAVGTTDGNVLLWDLGTEELLYPRIFLLETIGPALRSTDGREGWDAVIWLVSNPKCAIALADGVLTRSNGPVAKDGLRTNLDGASLEVVRLIAVLERVASPEAVAMLEKSANGPPGSLSADEARAALSRLEARGLLRKK